MIAKDRRNHDHVIVGCSSTNTSAYHHWSYEVYLILHYVTKFVSDLR